MKRFVGFLVALTMLVTVVGGCTSSSEQTTASQSSADSTSAAASVTDAAVDYSETGTLNLEWSAGIGTDSVFESPWSDLQSLYPAMVFDSLIKYDTDGTTILPALANSWEISADQKTYTFTLNDSVQWHDGTAFTADDVLFSLNTLLQVPESFQKGLLTAISGVQDVIDGKAETATGISASGNTVTLVLSTPDNTLMSTLAQLYILPKHLLGDVDPTLLTKYEEFWKKPIGTGAYKINEVSFPNYFTVVRNDAYFGKKANIKTVLFKSYVTGGVESERADIIAGNLDFAFGNAVNDITNATNITEKNTDVKMMIVPSTYQRQFWFNNVGSSDGKYNTDMQKTEVRQAINLLLDKESLASFYKGQAVALTTFVNPALSAYDTDIPLFSRDVEKAKAMLTEAGFDFSRTIRILYYYDDQTTKDFMEIVKQNFADAGITAEPFLVTNDLASVIYKVKNWDMIYAGSGSPDPIMTYKSMVPDKGIKDDIFGDIEVRENLFGKLLQQYTATTDLTEMKTIGDQIQTEALNYSLILPVYGMNKVVLYNSGRLKLDEGVFNKDLLMSYDLKFDQWELLK